MKTYKEIIEEEECEDGFQWCSKTKKCVKKGTGDGEGPRKKRGISEAKEKIQKIKLFYAPKDYDNLYTATDGKGNYSLNKDKSVNLSDSKEDLTVDGKPKAKSLEYDVMDIDGKLGVWDSNLKLIQKYKNMKDLLNDIQDLQDEEDIELLNWEE